MSKNEFVRCVQCGGQWQVDQTFTQLTNDQGEFLPLSKQPKLPMLVVSGRVDSAAEAKAKAVCYPCYQRGGASTAHALVNRLIDFGQSDLKPLANPPRPNWIPEPSAAHHGIVLPVLPKVGPTRYAPARPLARSATPVSTAAPPPRPQTRSSLPSAVVLPVNLEPEIVPEVPAPIPAQPESLTFQLADQLRLKQVELAILPKPGPGQIARYLHPEEGAPIFQVSDPPRPEVVKVPPKTSDDWVARTYALTGRPVPEVPLGLAPTAGPARLYTETWMPDSRHEEVVEEFQGLEIQELDWEFQEVVRPSGHNQAHQSIQRLVDRQILILAQEDPEYLDRLAAFRDYLVSQNIQ